MTVYENERGWSDITITFIDDSTYEGETDLIETYDGLLVIRTNNDRKVCFPMANIKSIEYEDR